MSIASGDDTLAAVVAFIDEFDARSLQSPVDLSVRVGVEAADLSTRKRQRSAAEAVHHNRSRDREKRELLRLRRETEQLNARLISLKTSAALALSGKRTTRPEFVSAWRRIAMRQYQLRTEAETENMELKDRIAEQRRVAKILEQITQREIANTFMKPNLQKAPKVPSWKCICAGGDPREVMAVFDTLLHGMRGLYLQTDARLSAHAIPSTPESFYSTRTERISTTAVAVNSIDTRFLPFEYDDVAEVYWGVGANFHCSRNDYFHEVSVQDGRDTVVRGQAFDSMDSRRPLRMRTIGCAQKYYEEQRVVIITAAHTNAVRVGNTKFDGIELREQYWHIFQRPNPLSPGACSMITVGRVELELGLHAAHTVEWLPGLFEYCQDRIRQFLDVVVPDMEDKLLRQVSL